MLLSETLFLSDLWFIWKNCTKHASGKTLSRQRALRNEEDKGHIALNYVIIIIIIISVSVFFYEQAVVRGVFKKHIISNLSITRCYVMKFYFRYKFRGLLWIHRMHKGFPASNGARSTAWEADDRDNDDDVSWWSRTIRDGELVCRLVNSWFLQTSRDVLLGR